MVIFGAGVITGGLLVHHSDRVSGLKHLRPAAGVAKASAASAGGQRFEFLRRAQRDLDLSPEQKDRVDHILKESQERTRHIMEPIAPELRDELQRTKEKFRDILTPAQRARFDELMKRPREHRGTAARERIPVLAAPTNSP
jgi:Spy/CpxP family protein refolding chaperone